MSEAREDGPASLPDVGDEVNLPDPPGTVEDDHGAAKGAAGTLVSLLNDIEDLIYDAKTYFDSELAYQKARASFVASCIKTIAAYGVVAIVVAIMALIAASVGLILALTPWITAWGATALVVGLMLLIVYLALRRIGSAWGDIMAAVREDREPGDDV